MLVGASGTMGQVAARGRRKGGAALAEFTLVLVCVGVLGAFARSLGSGALVDGLAAPPVTLTARAAWLTQHAGGAIGVVSLLGWLALVCGRQDWPLRVRLLLILAIWCVAGHALAWFAGRIEVFGLAFSGLLFWLSYGLALTAALCGLAARPGTHASVGGAVHWWIYPGWLLLSGLGILWLLDYSARGYPKYAYLGVYQFDAWLTATAALTLIAAALPRLLLGLGRQLARLEAGRTGGIALHVLLTGLWAVGVVGVAYATGYSGRQQVAMLAETLRLPIWLLAGWLGYRWFASGLRPLSAFLAFGALMSMLALGFWSLNDKGPILVQAVALSLLAGAVAAAVVGHHLGIWLGRAFALLLIGALLSAIAWAVFHYAPVDRLVALQHPHRGELEFLSELRWFMNAAPAEGFGLGQVPWCGNAASLGLSTCAGVPRQIQSDYVFAALVGVWGKSNAALLVVALLGWLASLAGARFSRAGVSAVDHNALAGWLVAMGVAAYVVQTVVSMFGTLGAMPLTGVGMPLLAYGGTSLLTLGLLAGMAINPLSQTVREYRS